MAYKILGFAIWKGAKWYLRRRYGDRPHKIAAGVVVGAVLAAGAVAAARSQRDD